VQYRFRRGITPAEVVRMIGRPDIDPAKVTLARSRDEIVVDFGDISLSPWEEEKRMWLFSPEFRLAEKSERLRDVTGGE